jgi:hypothetical protein
MDSRLPTKPTHLAPCKLVAYAIDSLKLLPGLSGTLESTVLEESTPVTGRYQGRYQIKLILQRKGRQFDLNFDQIIDPSIPLPEFGTEVELLSGADGDIFVIIKHHEIRLEAMVSSGLLSGFVKCLLDEQKTPPSVYYAAKNGRLRSSVM